MKILLDTNVVLDVLQKRSPWFEDGKEIFLAVAANQIDGFVTAKEVAESSSEARKTLIRRSEKSFPVSSLCSTLWIPWGKTAGTLSASKTTITKTLS